MERALFHEIKIIFDSNNIQLGASGVGILIYLHTFNVTAGSNPRRISWIIDLFRYDVAGTKQVPYMQIRTRVAAFAEAASFILFSSTVQCVTVGITRHASRCLKTD